MSTVAVEMNPICSGDLPAVGAFLEAHLNGRVPAERWAASLRVPWAVDAPNHGFMLVDGEQVVGVHLAFYADRVVDGRPVRLCNLGAWCVLPEYRFHGVRLLKALLAQDGHEFTDLSPSGNVVALNRRLGFRDLEAATVLVPSLPWPAWPRRCRISADPAVLERTLTGRDLDLFRDHAGTTGARHLVLIRGDEWCYVVFRKERRKGLELFARILHVSHPDVLRGLARPFARHLLVRHGAVASFQELRVVGRPPRLAVRLRSPRPRMFRSSHLRGDQIDYFYSELVCIAW